MANDKGYRVEYVALSEVARWPRNPKKHDEPGLDASLERFGFTEPLVLDEKSGRLVAGHGRLEALQRRSAAGKATPLNIAVRGRDQEWMVPVVRGISFKDVTEAEAYLLASNRLTEVGGWDDATLAKMLQDLSESASLEGTGFAPVDVTGLLRSLEAAEAPVLGLTPEERLPAFVAGQIKQVVLYFEAEQYDAVVTRLEAAQKRLGVTTNTEVFLKLLEHWESAINASPPPAVAEG